MQLSWWWASLLYRLQMKMSSSPEGLYFGAGGMVGTTMVSWCTLTHVVLRFGFRFNKVCLHTHQRNWSDPCRYCIQRLGVLAVSLPARKGQMGPFYFWKRTKAGSARFLGSLPKIKFSNKREAMFEDMYLSKIGLTLIFSNQSVMMWKHPLTQDEL